IRGSSPTPIVESCHSRGPMPGVSVVIPTWNGLDLLKEFLPSVLEACHCYSGGDRNPVQVMIVDDASIDATGEWLVSQGFRPAGCDRSSSPDTASRPPDLAFVSNEANAGFGVSCNRGFRLAAYNLILLLNNDVRISRDAISALVRHFDDSDVFAVH